MSQFNPLGPSQMFLSGIGQGANIASDAQRMAFAIRQQQELQRWREQQAAIDQQRYETDIAQQDRRDTLARDRHTLDADQWRQEQASQQATSALNAQRFGAVGGFVDQSGGAFEPVSPDTFMLADPVAQQAALKEQIAQQRLAQQAQLESEIERQIIDDPRFTNEQKDALILARRMNQLKSTPATILDRMLGTAFPKQAATPRQPLPPGMMSTLVPGATPEAIAAGDAFYNAGGTVDQARRAIVGSMPRQAKPDGSKIAQLESAKARLRAQKEAAEAAGDTRRLEVIDSELLKIETAEPYVKRGLPPPGEPDFGVYELRDDSQITPEAVDRAIDELGPTADPERIKARARAIQIEIGDAQMGSNR